MSETALVRPDTGLAQRNGVHAEEAAALESVVCGGDLAKLPPAQRVTWYRMRCEAAGLDPRTTPFQYIVLNGKLTLYATRTATDQLCRIHGLTTQIIKTERWEDLYIVTCRASTGDGRFTEEIGAVTIGNLKGDALANALMKANTKAKRRAVLSLCGLGALDETETETIPGARPVAVDTETGEVLDIAGRLETVTEHAPTFAAAATGGVASREQKSFFAALTEHCGRLGDAERRAVWALLLDPKAKAPVETMQGATPEQYAHAQGMLHVHCHNQQRPCAHLNPQCALLRRAVSLIPLETPAAEPEVIEETPESPFIDEGEPPANDGSVPGAFR